MSWQLIGLADVLPTPWRNGGGVTRELVAWPNAQDWDWRISVAEVASGGPFSRFEGVRRWLAILAGAGVRLDFLTSSVELTPKSPPLAFHGTDPVDCSLLDGAVSDLNLMLREGSPAGRTALMQQIAGITRAELDDATTVALYNLAAPGVLRVDGESLTLPGATLAWRSFEVGVRVDIEADCAVWMAWPSGGHR